MRIHSPTWTLWFCFLMGAAACQCGETSKTSTKNRATLGPTDDGKNPPGWDRRAFEVLLSGLPKSQIDAPLEAISPTLPWRASSEDPAAWLRFVQSTEGYGALKDTPLAQELRTQGAWLTVESLRNQAARLTSFVGHSQDDAGLLEGPLAIGTRSIEEARPGFVVVKRVLPEIQVVARFVAAFASLKLDKANPNGGGAVQDENSPDASPRLRTEKIGAVELHTLQRAGSDLYFSLFRDLLIFGSDESLVRQATRVAAGESKPEPDAHAELWSQKSEAGVHIAWRAPNDGPFGLFAIEALGFTLRPDAKKPFALRLFGGTAPSKDATELLRYAPGTTFGAWVDGRKPAEDLLQQARHRVLGASAPDSREAQKLEEMENHIVSKLLGGIAIWFSVDATDLSNPSPRGVVAFRHADKSGLEPAVRTLLAGLTDQTVQRTVLEQAGDAWLLTTGEESPAAALTQDALLVALSPTPLRDALHAGHGAARSVFDVAQIHTTADGSHAVYLDFRQGAVFLRNFYRAAFLQRGSPGWDEVAPVLEPTFTGLAKGGVLFGELKAARGKLFAGDIHALP